MSLSVKVQKNIGDYTEKVVGKLSIRTLACVAGGLTSAVAAGAICQFVFGIPVSDASLPVMAASLPFWLLGFYKPHHMKPEVFARLWLNHNFGTKRLLYRPTHALEDEAVNPSLKPKPSRAYKKLMRRKGVEHYEPSRQACS